MNSDGKANKSAGKRVALFPASQCITLFGSTLVQMAIVWYVTLKTSSGLWVSAFSVCSYLPQFLISFVGGVWADRYDRKKLIIFSDSAIALTTLALMLAMPYIKNETPLLLVILVVSAIRSLGAGIQTPAVNAVIPLLAPESDLMRINGINASVQSAVQFAAPAAAGLVLSLGSLRSSLLIDILTAAAGIGLLACIAIPRQPECEKKPMLDDMKQGRLFGLLGSAYSGFLPLGMLLFGPLADFLPLRWIMASSGVALIVLVAILKCDRRFAADDKKI